VRSSVTISYNVGASALGTDFVGLDAVGRFRVLAADLDVARVAEFFSPRSLFYQARYY
jgi:hypothetical protein